MLVRGYYSGSQSQSTINDGLRSAYRLLVPVFKQREDGIEFSRRRPVTELLGSFSQEILELHRRSKVILWPPGHGRKILPTNALCRVHLSAAFMPALAFSRYLCDLPPQFSTLSPKSDVSVVLEIEPQNVGMSHSAQSATTSTSRAERY